jgi:hypothetical protein
MNDVTFGVKVTEDLKNELSELMKTSDLSGKEFMNMLLATYKIEQRKQEDTWFESDIKELQILLHRIQKIYLNISEKSQIIISENRVESEETQKALEGEYKNLEEQYVALMEQIKEEKSLNEEYKKLIATLKQEKEQISEEAKESKMQAKNYLLLHNKFEEEILTLNSQIETFRRTEIEIEERNAENTKLKNRNDELSSEVWFLKRELEKINQEKNQLLLTHELELKNQLLEQKLLFNEKISTLKEENSHLQQEFHVKLEKFYETIKLQEEKEIKTEEKE